VKILKAGKVTFDAGGKLRRADDYEIAEGTLADLRAYLVGLFGEPGPLGLRIWNTTIRRAESFTFDVPDEVVH
jgi:hypothetical protein